MVKHRFKDGKRLKVYGKRAQVETIVSMLTRNLGAALRGRSHQARQRDRLLRVLTHNITLIFVQVFYRALIPHFQRDFGHSANKRE